MTLAPKIAMSDDFLKSFAAVPRDQQQAVLTLPNYPKHLSQSLSPLCGETGSGPATAYWSGSGRAHKM